MSAQMPVPTKPASRGRTTRYCGLRVRFMRGPRAGRLGVIVAQPGGNAFQVRLVDSGEIAATTPLNVELLDPLPPPLQQPSAWPKSPALRVLALFRQDPELELVVLYRSRIGRIFARPWSEDWQETEPEASDAELIGVYDRDVTVEQLREDLAP
ncbi:MAG TPA: hypothetical protein VEA81_00250 [Burkholderiaceae bacterium]|nr:hypothetical protein [Burkholderiaceae bacterium]